MKRSLVSYSLGLYRGRYLSQVTYPSLRRVLFSYQLILSVIIRKYDYFLVLSTLTFFITFFNYVDISVYFYFYYLKGHLFHSVGTITNDFYVEEFILLYTMYSNLWKIRYDIVMLDPVIVLILLVICLNKQHVYLSNLTKIS